MPRCSTALAISSRTCVAIAHAVVLSVTAPKRGPPCGSILQLWGQSPPRVRRINTTAETV